MVGRDGSGTRRAWYVAGGAIAVLGLVAGMVVVALNAVPLLTGDPDLRDEFAPDDTVTVELDPRDPPAVYAAESSSGFALPRTECEARSSRGEPVPLNPPGHKYRETLGGTTWAMVHKIDVPVAGSYTITCRGTGSDAPSSYAIGDATRAEQAPRLVLNALLGAVVGGLGCLIGGGIILLAWLRR